MLWNLLAVAVVLKLGQGRCNWYEQAVFSTGYHNAKFERLSCLQHFKSVFSLQKNNNKINPLIMACKTSSNTDHIMYTFFSWELKSYSSKSGNKGDWPGSACCEPWPEWPLLRLDTGPPAPWQEPLAYWLEHQISQSTLHSGSAATKDINQLNKQQ